MTLTELSWVILAAYFTMIVVIGMWGSWETAAIIAATLSILPLFLFTKEYFTFLKVTLIDAELFKITNFTAILIFDSIVIAYAFNAWARTLFIAVFIALIAWKLGLVSGITIPEVSS